MKKTCLIFATMFCLALFATSVSAQTTYTWNQTGTAAWTTDTNWTPTRTTPAANDILVFNNPGAFIAVTVTGVPTQTIGQLSASGSMAVNLQPAAGLVTLTIAGGAATNDLSVAAGTFLNINGGATNTNTLKILVGAGAIGVIDGFMTLSQAQHQLDAADASGITFGPFSTFTYNPGSTAGNAFTNAGTANAIVFGSGSTYIFLGGANPFGLTQPASKVVFQAGSLFQQTGTGTPSFSGRTYANYELNNAAANITVIGGSAVSINDLTITAGTLNFNMTGTPGHSIKGNVTVGAGGPGPVLNFAPLSAGTINFNGTSNQAFFGNGTINLTDADSTFVVNNASGITDNKNLIFNNSTLALASGNITISGTLTIGSAATVNRTSGHFIGNLRKVFAGAGSKTFEVGTVNGYSPVIVNATAGTFPANFDIRAVQSAHPNVSAGTSLARYWTLTNTTISSADLIFQYLVGDVNGTEANYKAIRISGGTPVSFPTSTVDTVGHTVSVNGVTGFSDWTAGEPLAPTAGNATISGRIVTSSGMPVEGAVVYLSGTQNRKFITDALGFYQFDNVETSGFYTVTPQRTNFGFSPGAQSFTQLSSRTEATFTAVPVGTSTNPLDTPEYFVRQHYLDFLGREPDEAGFNFWSDQILTCGSDAACIERRTINVSAAYFHSIEFQDTGGLVDRLYRASYGRNPLYAEFMPDTATIARNVQVGKNGWGATLAANREAFIASWVERAAFRTAFDSLTDDAYVGALISNTSANFTQAERDSLVSGLSAGTLSRAAVLQQIVNNENFARARFNEAFVMMEYFGYLRRDPDAAGLSFWLNKLNEFEGNFERAEMVKAFINSGEYRSRFVH